MGIRRHTGNRRWQEGEMKAGCIFWDEAMMGSIFGMAHHHIHDCMGQSYPVARR